jgi:hypothetical protein
MKKIFSVFAFFLMTVALNGQIPKKLSNKMGMFPLLFLDSVQTNMTELNAVNPFDISNITILPPKKATKTLGENGSDGAIYVTTVKAAKIKNWILFKEKSDKYNQLLNSAQADTIVQYVLNKKLLSDSAAPGKLYWINDKNFKSLQVIDKEKEVSVYTSTKRFIVLITARNPAKGLIKMGKHD